MCPVRVNTYSKKITGLYIYLRIYNQCLEIKKVYNVMKTFAQCCIYLCVLYNII